MKKICCFLVFLLMAAPVLPSLADENPANVVYFYKTDDGNPAALEQKLASYGQSLSFQAVEVNEDDSELLKEYAYCNPEGKISLPQTLFFDGNGSFCLWALDDVTAWSGLDTVVRILTGEGGYCLRTVDASGKAVSGVMLKLCDDSTCQVLTTGADGFAFVDKSEKSYQAAVLKAPAGYVFASEEYILNPDSRFATIMLTPEN